ncbi:hypothetical protein BDB01DRAFT_187703 [Pilobolus umbonatus]|nr:hypothetical protein BDB01DRAFT_187703 [Pilobolus umbonatus]
MTLPSSSSKVSPEDRMKHTLSLSEFLWRSPLLFNCKLDEYAKEAILARCYDNLWLNNENIMKQYYFSSSDELQHTLQLQCHRHDGKEKHMIRDPTSWHTNGILPREDLSSQKGRQCGHVFRKGEPVYRCRDCGLDDTCVFCSKCFHATNHDGHDILFSVSPGSGGCCDCGDAEAWKVPLRCTIHTTDNMNASSSSSGTAMVAMEPELLAAIRDTISTVLNFLLDTFSLAPDEVTLNSSIEQLVKENRQQVRTLSELGVPSQLSSKVSNDQSMDNDDPVEEDVDMDKDTVDDKLSGYKKDGELYACIAWNDEAHAFSHVLESIMTATGWEWERAKQIVDVIHVHGREIIYLSSDIKELRKIAAPLSAINLGVTIRPAKETFREQVCGVLVDWLNELVSGRKRFFENVAGGDDIIRSILCEELCADWELRLPLAILANTYRAANPATEDGDDEDEDDTKDEMAIASDTAEDVEMFEPDGDDHTHQGSSKSDSPDSALSGPPNYNAPCDIATIDWSPGKMVEEYQLLREEEESFAMTLTTSDRSRPIYGETSGGKDTLQAALSMQKEFEEKLRLDYFMLYDLKLWKEVRISLRELYISTLASSPHFKKTLGKRLARNYARLAESFLLKDREPENSIILFSVQLLTVPSVSDLLVHDYYLFGLICSTLTSFFLTDHLGLLLPSDRAQHPTRINCESRAFRTRRYFNAFHDLRYIMNVDMIKCVLALDPLYLRQYLDLISLFQGMNAQVCQKDTHVEYESEIWVNAFNVTLQIAKCCRQFSDCFSMLSLDQRSGRIQAAQTIVRSVSRILREILNWGKREDEAEEEEKAKRLGQSPALKIYGASAQVFHTITLRYTEPFEVIKYNVATQPVSFHHPLHWLLSGILEYAHILTDDVLQEAGWEGGFKKVITMFHDKENASTDVLLPILDFPIRTIVFSSQVRAGVWVRNGYGIRNQAHHYRDISLRENTYDADVFLLQLGFVTIHSNRFLATLLDRFDLINWFLGNSKHEYYDNSQTVFMVEELLNLLIVCVCERSTVLGFPITTRIRREIIHNLCLGSSSYSELTKRIPERITENPKFDSILSEVANFKPPEGVNDQGLYTLKDEHFGEIDTYFWHYSRNNREEAETVLKNRWKKLNPSKSEDDFFIIPFTQPIQNGPFKYIGQFLHSTVFIQMMAYAMWNVHTNVNHKSDTILDQTLYLVLLAVTNNDNDLGEGGSSGFYDYVCNKRFNMLISENETGKETKEMTLFEIMAVLRTDEQFNEITSRLDWIFNALEKNGPPNTRQIVYNWKAQRATNLQIAAELDDGNVELSEVEKKKLAAKERQKKIMAQFVQAQSQFMEQNEDLYEDDDEDIFTDTHESFRNEIGKNDGPEDIHNFCTYPTGTCIVCQEDVNDRSLPYGLLGLIQTSNILRETPMNDSSIFDDIYAMGPNLDVEWEDKQCLSDNATSIPGFPATAHKTGLYSSSCGHLMHIKCFEVYCTSIDSRHSAQLTRNHPENRTRKEFMCPLCKSLGNILLPIFWKGKKENFPGVLSKAREFDANSFYMNEVSQIVNKLKNIIEGSTRFSLHRRSNIGTTSRMNDAMAQLLPNLPTASQSNPVGRDWSPLTFSPRQPLPSLDPSAGLPGHLANETGESIIDDVDVDIDGSTSSRGSIRDSARSDISVLSDENVGPFDNDILHTTTSDSAPQIKKSYSRLMDVLNIIYQEICSNESEREMSTAVCNVDMLWGIMGYTIVGVEIAIRGISRANYTESPSTNTLFDQIPSQTQILLRIMSDTVMAYTNIMYNPNTETSNKEPPSMIKARQTMLSLGRMRQIFEINLDDIANFPGSDKIVLYDNAPLLEDDPFMILTEISLHLTSITNAEIYPFIHTLLLAELGKTAVGLLQDKLERPSEYDEEMKHQNSPSELSQDITAAKSFAFSLMSKLNFSPEEAHSTFSKFENDASFCALLKFFVLPFLRRTMILMVARFGLIIPALQTSTNDHQCELDRLLTVLRLPNFSELLQLTPMTESLLQYWCSQHLKESERRVQLQEGKLYSKVERLSPISLNLPTPLYLVALPKRLDRLFDESMRRVCNKCGTVPNDPALCLFCGTFVCAQNFCCSEDEEGECNIHTLECGGEIGMFLSVKRCILILLHNGNGWFMNTPYLDPHGEVDQGLRHGRPQYLSTKRYSEIRKLWLQHNVPIFVARQIEANYDIGGWTTL